MVLSDRDIKKAITKGMIVVQPTIPSHIQPSSIDIRLGNQLLVFRSGRVKYIDTRQRHDKALDSVELREGEPYILQPGDFVLGETLEYIEVGNGMVARLEGKSSLGRVGIVIHATAGYVDPGWKGILTLELSNVGMIPVTLYLGMKIGQISFSRMTSLADRPYGSEGLGSRYQGAVGPQAGQGHLDQKDRGAPENG